MSSVSRTLIATVLLATTAAACDGSSNAASPLAKPAASPSETAAESEYAPDIDPADFVTTIDNELFPLLPGTIFKLRGATVDGIERETITVTDKTKEVMGVTTTVVKDVMRVDGEIAEYTFDWYAQDVEGNVWYFGEDTAEYENNKIVSREGSWEAGVDGAEPGIIMSADPQPTDSYRQEYYKGHAEDMFWVVATGVAVKTPLGSFEDAVQVLEWTPLEPKIVVEKLYVAGTGLVSEHALSGSKENVRLVEVIRPE
jgi:hypothetical protein